MNKKLSLREIARRTNSNKDTIGRYKRNRPELFAVIVKGLEATEPRYCHKCGAKIHD